MDLVAKLYKAQELVESAKLHLHDQLSRTEAFSKEKGVVAEDGSSTSGTPGRTWTEELETPNTQDLPPGYVFISGSRSDTGKDTYLCSICRHQSTDLFTMNVVCLTWSFCYKTSTQLVS